MPVKMLIMTPATALTKELSPETIAEMMFPMAIDVVWVISHSSFANVNEFLCRVNRMAGGKRGWRVANEECVGEEEQQLDVKKTDLCTCL